MELLFWLIIILIWIFISLLKRTKTIPTKEEPSPPPKEWEEILETLGFPIPPKPEPPREIKLKLKEAPVVLETRTEKPPSIKIEEKRAEKEKVAFLTDRWEEGIILSTILGPPKAYQILPRCRNGIRSGLKNRWP